MDDTTNQGMSGLSMNPVEPKNADPIVPGGPTVSLSQDPIVAQPMTMPSEPTFGVASASVAGNESNSKEDVIVVLKRIEDKLSAIALKVGA